MTSRAIDDDDDDRPPPAKSARVKPASTRGRPGQRRINVNNVNNSNHSIGGSGLTLVKRPKSVDPRFDPMFGGLADQRHFEKSYSFLLEQQAEEEQRRRFRIRCLKCVLKRHELDRARIAARSDAAATEGGGRGKKTSRPTAEEEDEDEDLDAYEKEIFGDEHQQELRALKLTPPQHIYRELDELKRDSQLYISRTKNTVAVSRRDEVKKDLMRKEVQAVKAGTKARPFFPKRAELKRAVLSDRFDRLEEKGGKDAVDRYLSRKVKH